MRFSYFILLYVSVTGLYSQYNSEFLNFDKSGRSVSVNAEYDLGSNAIQNKLINTFIFGGHIDSEIKDKALSNMKGYNVLGGNVKYDVNAFFGKNTKYSFLIGFKNQELFNATFTKDVYTLAFYGNKPFLGQTANFGGTNINALRFQELKFGLIWHKIDTTAKIGLALSVLKGEQLFFIKGNKNSSLYTNSDGTELMFNSNFNMALSDTSTRKNTLAFNGIGASADIFFETPYKSNIGQSSLLTVNVNNIGFIHWFDNSIQYSSDSTFKFDGYHVNTLYDLSDSTLQKINTDTLIRNATNARKEAFNTNIPTNLLIINKINFTSKFALNTGFRYIFHANNKPYLFIETEHKLSERIIITSHLAYGGYAKLQVGASFVLNTPHWYFKLGSNSLQGFVATKYTHGQGLFFSLAKKFN